MVGHNKPAGHFVRYDRDGRKVEGETRQCAHCQFTWEYVPGSGNKRRVCLKCMGLCCGRPECRDCSDGAAPFHDVTMAHDRRYRLSEGGVYLKEG